VKITFQPLSEFFVGGIFRLARRTLLEEVAVGKQGDQEPVDQRLLTDNAALQLPAQLIKSRKISTVQIARFA
jgi:hypothetical protein